MGTQPKNNQKTAKCLHRQPSFSKLDKSPRFFLIGLICLATVFVGSAVFYINTHVRVVELGYDITQALNEKQELTEQNKQLSLKVAQLRSPARLEQVAQETLNMHRPQSAQILRLSQLRLSQPKTHDLKQNLRPDLKSKTPQVLAQKNITPQKTNTQKVTLNTRLNKSDSHNKPSQKKSSNLIVAQAKSPNKVLSRSSQPKYKQVPTALLDSMP